MFLTTFLATVAANVLSYYIIKWLDRRRESQFIIVSIILQNAFEKPRMAGGFFSLRAKIYKPPEF